MIGDPLLNSRRSRARRFKRIPMRILLPNVVTLLAVCSGVTAIRLGIEGRFELAVGAVVLACVLDAIDGRLARVLKGASKFGAELDSLADFVNFGVAPAVLIYIWSLQALKTLGWVIALGLAVCCALRLARFNVASDEPEKPAWKFSYFSGVPAPAGAGLAMLPLYLGFLGIIPDGRAAAPFILPWTALVAAAMISSLPTFSLKSVGQRVRRDHVMPMVMGVVFSAVLLISYPFEMLAAVAIIYIISIPFGYRAYRRQNRAWLARQAQAANASKADHVPDQTN